MNFYSDKNVYNSSSEEKTLRGSMKAAVQRAISTDTLVVLDAPNYIKGYRYELYCISKQHSTKHCIVQCAAPAEDAWLWNTRREPAQQFSRETFDALVYRYEAPDNRNRWDSPLFTSLPSAPLDLEAVSAALYSGKAVKPHQATQLQPLTDNNFIHRLDNITQEVVSTVLSAQKTDVDGEIVIPGTDKTLQFGRKVPLPELSRARRQFLSYCKSRPVHSQTEAVTCFVTYLSTTLS